MSGFRDSLKGQGWGELGSGRAFSLSGGREGLGGGRGVGLGGELDQWGRGSSSEEEGEGTGGEMV